MQTKNLFAMILIVSLSVIVRAEAIVDAAKIGDLQSIQQMLEQDPGKLNATDGENYTALHWACMRGHWDVARYLIKLGANLNIKGGDGGTPLQWAVHHDNVEIVKLMLEKGAQLNSQNQWGMTELHTASFFLTFYGKA